MAGPNLTNHNKIILTKVNNQSGVGANITLPEDALQTFYDGSPLTINTTGGYMTIWNGTAVGNGATKIIGFASMSGSNLATAGLGYMLPFGTDGFPGAAVTDPVGVQFQPNAVVIPPGARATNGSQNAQLGNKENWFEAQVDNSAGAVAADYETSYGIVGGIYGLTSDSNGTWYVDLGITPGEGANVAVQVMELNPIDGPGNVSGMLNGRVRFTVLAAAYEYGS